MSDSLWPHGLQYARPPSPSPTSGACSNSCPLSQWCHPTISSSVVPFSHLQSFPASGSFQMSRFFPSGGQSIGVSASASVLPMNIQDWFPLGVTSWISLQSYRNVIIYLSLQSGVNFFFPLWKYLWNHNSSRKFGSLGKFDFIYKYTERKLRLIIWSCSIKVW